MVIQLLYYDAFLKYNNAFEVMCFNSYMTTFHEDTVRQKMPLCLRKPRHKLTQDNSSLWLRKVI